LCSHAFYNHLTSDTSSGYDRTKPLPLEQYIVTGSVMNVVSMKDDMCLDSDCSLKLEQMPFRMVNSFSSPAKNSWESIVGLSPLYFGSEKSFLSKLISSKLT